ncbi:TetR/AcrR family transcriptional regulator [Rhabdothermincola salaria]|uniref:TetR/AcrR family transcriptional regulator n=1 Tax=Rhabdothermincola salaria TaxID=2903142 RepID=UPI001E2D1317|nr:TetR family transcriptional regulator [Rhabdothermincola salaria]MCD9623959.1 TetR family transcriptional regulator [Rhabdothermincola salaria]
MSTARAELLSRVMDHVAAHGLSDVSLRELAGSVGTSHRMLLYHFSSREGLVAAVVESMEDRQRQALEALSTEAASPRQLIEAQWAQLSDPATRPFVLLFFEVLALALHDRPGTEGFLDHLTEPWLDLAERLATDLDARTDRDELRLGVAVSRGLLLEAVASGDVEAATRSLHRFLDMWDATRPDTDEG